jgi:tetratricopeptide (TPR) repeat protein
MPLEQAGMALFERALYGGERRGPWRADAEASWEMFERALALDPSSLDARIGRGFAALVRTVFEPEWLERAIADFREVVRAAPDLPRGRIGLGDALTQAKLWKEAAAQYERAIELDPALRGPYGPALEECRSRGK